MTAGQRVSDIIRVSNTLAAGPVEIAPAAKVKTSQILCFALPLFSYIMLCFALALFCDIILDQVIHFHLIPPLLHLLYM